MRSNLGGQNPKDKEAYIMLNSSAWICHAAPDIGRVCMDLICVLDYEMSRAVESLRVVLCNFATFLNIMKHIAVGPISQYIKWFQGNIYLQCALKKNILFCLPE